jgi:hypothetical protein
MDKYTPMLTGALKKSPTLGTKVGSGRIEYASPYARYQYYGKLMVSSVTGSPYARSGEKKVLTSVDLEYNTASHPLAGPFWFERMKSEHKDEILRGAAQMRVKINTIETPEEAEQALREYQIACSMQES